MTDPFDQDAYWIARHRRLGPDPRAVGNMARSAEENLAGERQLAAGLSAALSAIGATGRVLDIGCGHGRLSSVFCDAGLDYTGLDVSPDAVAAARMREPRGQFITGSALSTDWNGPFDLVAVIYVLVHFVDDGQWLAMLERIAGALRPGGGLLIADDFPPCPERRGQHVAIRTLDQYRSAFQSRGLALDETFPAQPAEAEAKRSGPFRFARRLP